MTVNLSQEKSDEKTLMKPLMKSLTKSLSKSGQSAMKSETHDSMSEHFQKCAIALSFLNQRILGKEDVNRLALACLMARGHLLLEDVPGVGKTTMAKALAEAFGLKLTRIQFTNDLLPADVIGGVIFNSQTNEFKIKRGPIFSEFVLADELNRGSPRTQSAVLEAMEERRVTIDGITHELPEPFLFVATQNPHFQSGTHPLPESQLDRFLMTLHLGFPAAAAEKELIRRGSSGVAVGSPHLSDGSEPARQLTKDDLLQIQSAVGSVHLSDKVVEYIQDLVAATRTSEYVGVSPRGAISLSMASRAMAVTHQRDFVIPEDVQAVAVPVLAHRWLRNDQEFTPTNEKVRELIQKTAVP